MGEENKDKIKFMRKIFEIHNLIKITKDNNNGKYKFKDLGDIYATLKPLLELKQIFLQFKSYKIIEEKENPRRYLSLEMILYDFENDYDESIESKIEIDEKMLMNQMQKIISSKTFLKKTMLDDYFMITEEDPEHNIKGDNSKSGSIGNSKSGSTGSGNKSSNNSLSDKEKQELEDKLNYCKKYFWNKSGKDEKKSIELLKKATEYQDKKTGKIVEGIENFEKLKSSDIKLKILYNTIKK